MGKKYLVVEVEEKSSSDEPTTSLSLRFLLFVACMVFPPLIFILNIKREKSSFDENDAYDGGYFFGPCVTAIILGLLWSIVMVGLSASDVARSSPDIFAKDVYEAIFALSVTYCAAYLLDLITAIVVARITDIFSSHDHLNQKIGNVSIVIVCILFMGGILATILLGV